MGPANNRRRPTPSKVNLLPEGIGGLAHQLPPRQPGTLFVLGENRGMSVAPGTSFRVEFGRDVDNVHIVVGSGDKRVSRRHGYIQHQGDKWIMYNTGKPPIRFPRSPMLLSGDWAVLPSGYSPLFIVCGDREHLLEVRVVSSAPPSGPGRFDEDTIEARKWALSEDERLAVVCLAQRYLGRDPFPQPLTWTEAAKRLAASRPEAGWDPRKVERVVTKVRDHLSGKGVRGLTREEVGEPVGNTLNHNLITELLASTSIVPEDLDRLDKPKP